MDDVIELTGSGMEHEILTRTSAGGLLGGELLEDDPLASYIGDGERPQYVVRSKKSGLTIERETGTETIDPDSDYQALLLVTDLQVVCAVGKETGDHVERLQLDDVFEARAEHRRLRTSTLQLETQRGTIWQFTCKGNPEPVATAINDISQTWLYLEGLLADVETALDESEGRLPADRASVQSALAESEANLRTVSQQVENVNEGVRADIESTARRCVERLVSIRRALSASEGAHAHARAQTAWHDQNYELAVATYNEAIEAYESALDLDGPTPAGEQLARRLDGATTERALVRIWPLVEADSKRRLAVESTAREATQHWPQVFERYVELLALADSPAFDIDRDTLRKQMTAVADDAIEDHYETGARNLETGDEYARTGENEQAQDHYTTARSQFEQAQTLAASAREGYLDTIETAIYTADRRVEGEVPDEPVEQVVPPLEASDETDSRTHSTDSAAEQPLSREGGLVEDGSEPLSVIDRIKAQKGADDATSDEPGDEPDDESDDEAADQADDETDSETGVEETKDDSEAGTDESRDSATHSIANGGTAVDTDESVEPDSKPEDLQATLRGLSEEAFTELVASLLEANGWETRAFSTANRGTYDIVATRESPDERRYFVWAVHRPDGGELGATLVRRAATAREADPRADGVTLVTTGSLLTNAQQRADELDVTVVDGETLAEQVAAANITEMLRRLHQ